MKSGDRQGSQIARNELKTLMRKYQISNMYGILSLLQMPFYITYFIALRYLVFSPEKYSFILNSEFLWIKDLSMADPMYILPVLSGVLSFLTIRLNMKNGPANNAGPAFLKKFKIYLPYLPFFGIFFMSTFPAALNLYWCSLSGLNYILFWMFQNQTFLQLIGIPKYYKGTKRAEKFEKNNRIFKKAVFDTDQGENKVKVFKSKPKKIKKNKK